MGFEGWGYTVHISDIHKVLKLSCLINDWKNRGACPQVSVFLGRDGRLTVRVRPGSYKLYLISKYLLDDRKYFAALFRELDKEGEYECENCQDGKAHIHNDGGFLLESRKRCPAMAAFEKTIDSKPRQGPASPAVVHEMESYKKFIDYFAEAIVSEERVEKRHPGNMQGYT